MEAKAAVDGEPQGVDLLVFSSSAFSVAFTNDASHPDPTHPTANPIKEGRFRAIWIGPPRKEADIKMKDAQQKKIVQALHLEIDPATVTLVTEGTTDAELAEEGKFGLQEQTSYVVEGEPSQRDPGKNHISSGFLCVTVFQCFDSVQHRTD
jgi:hypothetical protein